MVINFFLIVDYVCDANFAKLAWGHKNLVYLAARASIFASSNG